MPECVGDFHKICKFFLVGYIVHAIDKRLGGASALHLADCLCHSLVGKEHKLLDEFVGVFRLLEIHIYGTTGLVDIESHLAAVEVDGAFLVATRPENFGKAV